MDEEQAPPSIKLGQHPFDLDFHPHGDFVAVGLITGEVEIFKYNLESCDKVLTVKPHKDSCRATLFTQDGNALFTASSDKSVKAIGTTGQELWNIENAHSNAVNAMHCLNPTTLVTGDDVGCIKVWDIRQTTPAMTFEENEDFISSFASNSSEANLLAASGDGTLSIFDLPGGKLWAKSDDQEDELLSITLMKNEKKVVCGTQDGILLIWSWGTWGDISDRLPGHPSSIDTILAVDQDTMCTGSSDGIIRIVNIHPNKLLGLVGDHDDFPVERMKFSRDIRLIGSLSHDETVYFWDASYLQEGNLGDAEGVEMKADSDTDMKDSDDESFEDEEADSSDDEDEGAGGSARRLPQRKTAAEKFFADL